jgi:hypothetical protein
MPFLKGTATAEQGEWFLFGKDSDDAEIRFKVRRISPGKEHEIERRHSGRKGELHSRKGDLVLPVDRDADLAAEIEKAVYCLIESENVAVVMLDQDSADSYGAVLSEALQPGKPSKLDGKWTPELKRLFLSDELNVGRRIIKESRKLGVKAIQEEEEGKGDSSSS